MLMTGRRCGDVLDLFSSVVQVLECCCGDCPPELALALQHVDSAESFLDTIFPPGAASSSFALRVIQITAARRAERRSRAPCREDVYILDNFPRLKTLIREKAHPFRLLKAMTGVEIPSRCLFALRGGRHQGPLRRREILNRTRRRVQVGLNVSRCSRESLGLKERL